MPWVAMDTGLERNRKVIEFRLALGWSVNDTTARLYRFFAAVREQAPDGNLTDWSPGQVARAMEPEVNLDADPIMGALIGSQLLWTDERDQLLVHGWWERNGIFIRENATTQARAAGGRKGGAKRAATGERDPMGRYKRSLEPVWNESGASSHPDSPDSNHTHHTEQEQEQEQEPKSKAASSPSLRSGEEAPGCAASSPQTECQAPPPDAEPPEPPVPLSAEQAVENRHRVARLVASVGAALSPAPPAKPPPSAFPGPQIWATIQGLSAVPKIQDGLMVVAGWLWKHGERDVALIEQALRRVSQAQNPFAYFRVGGEALEALRGQLAGDRASAEREANAAADSAFLAPAPRARSQ